MPVGVGGTLADYVPFYFAPRSPMLFTIHRGNVEGYQEGQRPIVHLVASVEAAVKVGRPWVFTNGHAEMAYSDFCVNLERLDEFVDWGVMRSNYWNDTMDQPDRKRQRQAEFLVHEFFPWTAIERIGVRDQAIRQQVELALIKPEHKPGAS